MVTCAVSDGGKMTDGWQESYEVMDGCGTDDEFWAIRSEVKVECGTVGFVTFEGYHDPTSSRRVYGKCAVLTSTSLTPIVPSPNQ